MRLVADALTYEPNEVLRCPGQLEADEVGAEQSLKNLSAPGKLLEELCWRERYVQEKSNPQVGAQFAQ